VSASEFGKRFRQSQERRADELAAAERDAAARGKEAFDAVLLAALLGEKDAAQGATDDRLREKYYVGHPEILTLSDFADLLRRLEPWR